MATHKTKRRASGELSQWHVDLGLTASKKKMIIMIHQFLLLKAASLCFFVMATLNRMLTNINSKVPSIN